MKIGTRILLMLAKQDGYRLFKAVEKTETSCNIELSTLQQAEKKQAKTDFKLELELKAGAEN